MLAYTIGFCWFYIVAGRRDFTSWHLIVFTVWDWICDILTFVGNLLFSLNCVPPAIRRPWRVVFPILVLEFLVNWIYDSLYGTSRDSSVALSVFVWTVCVLLYVPTFWANYKIGYGKEADFDAVA